MRPTLPALPLLASLLLSGAAAAQASLAGPRLFPRGAQAPGSQETVYDALAGAYRFRLKSLTGATIVEYVLPLQHLYMQRGVLRIEESTTGVVPMACGGLMYRTDPPAGGSQPGGNEALGNLIPAFDLAFTSPHVSNHTATLLSHALDPATGVVSVTFEDAYVTTAGTQVSQKTYALRAVGRSLEIRATSPTLRAAHNYAGFHFWVGDALPSPALAFHVPYMDAVPVFVGGNGAFVSRIVDWYRSSSSEGVPSPEPSLAPSPTGPYSTFQGETAPAYYRNDHFELNAPIDETVYLTVSTEVEDVMPVVDRPPSQYRRHMAERSVSQAAPGTLYTLGRDWVFRAKSLGLTDMAHIKWDWNRWPLNLNEPDTLPVAPPVGMPPGSPIVPCGTIWGNPADWLSYASTARDANWTFAPYFQESSNDPGYPTYPKLLLPGSMPPEEIVLTPNPAYDAAKSVRDANGALKPGWNTEHNLGKTNLGGQGIGHYTDNLGTHLRPARHASLVDAINGLNGYTPFAVAGAHIDAATGLADRDEIDQRKLSGFARTIAENLRWREESFGVLKDGLAGPLFGENSHWRAKAFESYNAGLLDGTSRKIPVHWTHAEGSHAAESKDYLVVPDFELGQVLPKATGFFGMGWEAHLKEDGPWGSDDGFVDEWNTTLLSYGHAPYFSTNGDVEVNYWLWRTTLRSHFLCHGVSKAMRTSTITEVRYEDDGGVERTLSEALLLAASGSMNLAKSRLVLRFANGLEFKANHSSYTWPTYVRGQACAIPTNGFVASAPDGLFAMSAINLANGARLDYAYNPGHSIVLDRRGVLQSIQGFPESILPALQTLPEFSGLPQNRMVFVHDLRTQMAMYASGDQHGWVSLGASPAPMSLAVAIDDTDQLSTGRPRLGVRAVLTDGLGQEKDVTRLCTWSSSDPAKVAVNAFGGLTMHGSGSADVTASYAPASLTTVRTIGATRKPVLTTVVLEGLSSTRALLSFSTDSACGASVLVSTDASFPPGSTTTHLGRPDPAQKLHQFSLRNLLPQTTYFVRSQATNGLGLSETGVGFSFTTL